MLGHFALFILVKYSQLKYCENKQKYQAMFVHDKVGPKRFVTFDRTWGAKKVIFTQTSFFSLNTSCLNPLSQNSGKAHSSRDHFFVFRFHFFLSWNFPELFQVAQ